MNHAFTKPAAAAVWMGILTFLTLATPLHAEQSGLFTYRLIDGGSAVEITDYPETETGTVVIPAQIDGKPVTSIGERAFWQCSGLTSVTIPSSVTSIGMGSFGTCGALASVTIPESVTSIGNYAFYECSSLTSLEIPGDVASIGDHAFESCSGLSSVTIPASVTSIGKGPLSFADSLMSISVDSANPDYSSAGGVLFDKLQTLLIQHPCGLAGDYVIPSSVTDVADHAFEGSRLLTSVTIPGSVTRIGGAAFHGCDGLASVMIPASVTNMGDGPFASCASLMSIPVDPANPNYHSSGGVLFDKPQTTLVQYPGGLAGDYLIPSSVTSIGPGAFLVCTGLSKVTIPASVTNIGDSAFSGCSGLTDVTIPSSVTSIGSYAFYDCSGLSTAIFMGDAPILGGTAFDDADPGFTIYHLGGSTGFTSPTWEGYPSRMIDEASHPAAPWLLTHGLPYHTDLNQDLNGDGVDLLMAYALDLYPRNARAEMPQPILGPTTLGMEFYASAPGVIYMVQTSTDMEAWTTDGVSLSPIDTDGRRIATVDRNSPHRFLRLVVAE